MGQTGLGFGLVGWAGQGRWSVGTAMEASMTGTAQPTNVCTSSVCLPPLPTKRFEPSTAAMAAMPAGCSRPLLRGLVEVHRVADRSVTTRSYATSPLKLMAPRGSDRTALVYSSTYGGGLVAGDQVDLEVRVGPVAACILGTQASTKVYRSPNGIACRQSLYAKVDEGGALCVIPDPVTCFTDAVYEQSQTFCIHHSASLLLIDWLTSGRLAGGERWAFSRYRSRSDIYIDDQLVFTDATLLTPDEGLLCTPSRMGRFNCMAMVVWVGPPHSGITERLIQQLSTLPLGPRQPLIGAASQFGHGIVLRLMGTCTEKVARFLNTAVALPAQLGTGSPWTRKWI